MQTRFPEDILPGVFQLNWSIKSDARLSTGRVINRKIYASNIRHPIRHPPLLLYPLALNHHRILEKCQGFLEIFR